MMGQLSRYMTARVGKEVMSRGVVVWWDSQRVWEPWIDGLSREEGESQAGEFAAVSLASTTAVIVRYHGSYLELADRCDELLAGEEAPRIILYVPGERHVEELSPLRELECMGGEASPFQPNLVRSARQAYKNAGMPDGRIDEVLEGDALTFRYLDDVTVGDGDEASPLTPIFGSGREADVIPAFLTRKDLREETAEHGLLETVRGLVDRGLGLDVKPSDDPDELAARIARAVLVAELRADLSGEEPPEVSQIPKIQRASFADRVRRVCKKLRLSEPDAYIRLAQKVESDLGLARAQIDPMQLGRIDTFSFEERALLTSCAEFLENGNLAAARTLVEDRASSFWTSLERFPERRAEWQLLESLVDLSEADTTIEEQLSTPPTAVRGWVEHYVAEGGWQRADRLFRAAYSRLKHIDGSNKVDLAAQKILAAHDELVDEMTRLFIKHLEEGGWTLDDVTRQRDVYEDSVRKSSEPVAMILADALRFEMGVELGRLLEAAGATGVQLEPAAAETPTITAVGMAALLPGAERSFNVVGDGSGLHGAIGQQRCSTVHDRMQYAKAEVPGLVEMTLDELVEQTSRKKLTKAVEGAPVVLVRSTEIDAVGETLPASLARRIMGSILEDIRKGVLKLADAGIRRFVVVADHGHLFGPSRDDSMKIDAPTGGEQISLHRRCWVGKGGSTPSGCVRVSLQELGYASDLDLIVPRGNGVFRSGGGLAYYHGGLSLQELLIPVLSFQLEAAGAERRGGSDVVIRTSSDKVTNRIFTATIQRTELALEPLKLRILALDKEGHVVGQARHADAGWDSDSGVLELAEQDSISVAIQLDDDSVDELRISAIEVDTDRTVKETKLMPVDLVS